MNRGFRSAFRYQVTDLLKNATIFFAVMVAIVAALIIGALSIRSSGNIEIHSSFNGLGLASAICQFVFGISVSRSNLRLCTQLGVSRRSAFFSLLLSGLAVSVILAVAGEALIGSLQLISFAHGRLTLSDLYQMIYAGASSEALSFTQHLNSVLMITCLLLCCFSFGVFFTLLFWRLNKALRIVVAIAIPLAINGVPVLLYRLGINLKPLFIWLSSSVYHLDLFFLLLTLVFIAIEWLLLRHTNIKAPAFA